MKNWKTTLAGIVAVLPLLAQAIGHPISADVASAIQTIAVALGLFSAKDNNVTGGTKQ